MDALTSVAARDAALDLVELGAPADWLTDAQGVVNALAASGEPFSADDVWAKVGAPPEPRALGAVMVFAARQGWIRKTGLYRPSTRPAAHARPIAEWVGVRPDDGTLFG